MRSAISCPKVVKLYSNGVTVVDIMDQRKKMMYRLDCKSSTCFYLRIFFDLMDVAYINSNSVYNIRNPYKLTLLGFKMVVSKNLIQWNLGPERAVASSQPNKRKIHSSSSKCNSSHAMKSQQTRKRWEEMCMVCETPLCLVKDRNCFQLHHLWLRTLKDHFRLYTCYIKLLCAIAYW